MKKVFTTIMVLTIALITTAQNPIYGFVECYTEAETTNKIVLMDLKNSRAKAFKINHVNQLASNLVTGGLYTLDGVPLREDEFCTILLFDESGKCQSAVNINYKKREKLITFNIQPNWTLRLTIRKNVKSETVEKTVFNYSVPGID